MHAMSPFTQHSQRRIDFGHTGQEGFAPFFIGAAPGALLRGPRPARVRAVTDFLSETLLADRDLFEGRSGRK